MLERARQLICFFIASALAFLPLCGQAEAASLFAHSPSSHPRYAAIVVDAQSGEVLYAKRSDSPRYPASITKVMTLYLTFEALSLGYLKDDDLVVMSARAAAQGPTKLGLPAGDSLMVSEAMQALAIKSANDVAVALAEKVGGSEERFAALMTLKAQDLGMTSTHFVNASGLPDSRQLTSARDIAILSRAVMRDYPQYYRLFSQESFTFRGTTMNNHNGLLGRMPGVDGLKTGFTNASGYNLAVSAVRNERRLVAVVMGGGSTAARNRNAEDLLMTGFDILARRQRGEVIEMTQNVFEPAPVESVLLAVAEQDDRELAPSRVVFTSASVSAKAPKLKLVDPHTTRLRSGKSEDGPWSIQVGAFGSKGLAKSQLTLVTKAARPMVAETAPTVLSSSGIWKAQFRGFSEGSARQTCSMLKSKKFPCLVINPG